MKRTANPKRDVAIDIARAVCIILVVIGHFHPDYSPRWYTVLHDCIYTFHMPVFLFIGGYIYACTRRKERYATFLQRKARRLLLPYFSTSVVVITIKLLTENVATVDAPTTVYGFIEMFYRPAAGAFLWFIWVMWFMFMIVPLLKNAKVRLAALVITFIIHLLPIEITDIFCLNKLRLMAFYFMLGVCTRDIDNIFRQILAQGSIWLVMPFVVMEYICIQTAGITKIIACEVAPLLGIVVIIGLSQWLHRYAETHLRALLTTGACSYMIYLFHTTFEGFAKGLFAKFPYMQESESCFVLIAITVIGIGITVPILLQLKIIERSRLLSMAFGLSRKTRA